MNQIQDADFQAAIEKYIDNIKQDYQRSFPANTDVRKTMIENFNQGIKIKLGQKYIKVITGTSVHSFIQLVDDGKFKRGDVLMAASWAAPAKNFSRGNIFTSASPSWTGA